MYNKRGAPRVRHACANHASPMLVWLAYHVHHVISHDHGHEGLGDISTSCASRVRSVAREPRALTLGFDLC
jgi:hypothetical protein